jgi:SAM-dependent methyltransferase
MYATEPDDFDPGNPAGGDGTAIVLADGARWRAESPHENWDVTIYLRTPPPAGRRCDESPEERRDRVSGHSRRGHGDGEFGADIVIDHHDERWPVIRHVAADLEHAADRLYLDETRAFFATRAFRWNDRFGDDRPAYEQAIRESDVPRGGTVVDVGCGTGRALPAMRDAVGDGGVVIGIDLTPEMLTVASLQCTSQFQLVLADARRLPLADGSVDAVFAAGLVQHLPDPRAGLAELARVTRPGGRLIIFHPSGRAALAARHGRTLRDDEPLAPHQLRGLLDGSGWSLVRYDDPPHRFYALAERTAMAGQSRVAQRAAVAESDSAADPRTLDRSPAEMSVAGGHE